MSFPPPTERQAKLIWFALSVLAVTLTVAILGAVFWALGRLLVVLSPVLWPLAVAAMIAFVLDPLVDLLASRGVPRLRAILLVFGAAGFLVLGVLGSVVPRAVVQARDLAGRIPDYTDRMRAKVQVWIDQPPSPLMRLLPAGWQERFSKGGPPREGGAASNVVPVVTVDGSSPGGRPVDLVVEGGATNGPTSHPPAGVMSWWGQAMDPSALKTAGDWLVAVAPGVGQWLLGQLGRVASWVGVLAGLALIPIYAFYFLLEKASIERNWTSYLPVSDSRFKDELVWLLRNINDALIVFFRGQVLVAICDGVLYTIGFFLIGLEYALLLGLMATVLTIIPFLGAIVTCGMALLIALVQYSDWQHPLGVLAVFALVQALEGWVIQPKIIGDRVGLHPVTIIVALLVGTTLMGGILGGLLAIPATAVLRALMFRYVWRSR